MLVEKDQQKADKRLKEFEKTCRNYPYPGEIEAEREIIGYIQQLASGGRRKIS